MTVYSLTPGDKPEGYGESILPLEAAKVHLAVLHDWQDDLIAALRDAAIDWVERYTAIPLAEQAGLVHHRRQMPTGSEIVRLGAWPLIAVTAISYARADGTAASFAPANLMFGVHDEVMPRPGQRWPDDSEGPVTITFTAGLQDAQAQRPALVSAVRMMMAHLYLNREAVITNGATGETPFGVIALCGAHRLPVLG